MIKNINSNLWEKLVEKSTQNSRQLGEFILVTLTRTRNNLMVEVKTENLGEKKVIFLKSFGMIGIKHGIKSLAEVNEQVSLAIENIGEKISNQEILLKVRGLATNEVTLWVEGLQKVGLKVKFLSESTKVPHNGSKVKKLRRL